MPKVENKVNWTTLIAAFGVAVTVGGYVYATGQFTARMDNFEATTTEKGVRSDLRITALESEVRKVDKLDYRVTLVEQNNVVLNQTLTELSRAISDQGADIKVIREILARIDPKKP